ncbi:sel1 repeat family protein [Ectothiorhodospiraceae bacterium 2226]|nr:sel1 repeat family protein [Ectothiorhodospiraceae bacterium 2226]
MRYFNAVTFFLSLVMAGAVHAQAAGGSAELVQQGRAAFAQNNFSEAARLYRLAAERGDRDAQHLLGHLYQQGRGVSKDPAEAFRLFKLAADQGERDSQHHVGDMYYDGIVVARDEALAIEYLKKSAEQGYGPAFRLLGMIGFTSDGTGRYEGLIDYLPPLVNLYDDIHGYLGAAYMEGRGGLPVDFAKAAHHYREANAAKPSQVFRERAALAERLLDAQSVAYTRGHLTETLMLAEAYSNGWGGAYDELPMRFALAGGPERFGSRPRMDFEAAFRLYELAAAQGHLPSMRKTYQMLDWGEGIAQDRPRAAQLLQEIVATAQKRRDWDMVAWAAEKLMDSGEDFERYLALSCKARENGAAVSFHVDIMCGGFDATRTKGW